MNIKNTFLWLCAILFVGQGGAQAQLCSSKEIYSDSLLGEAVYSPDCTRAAYTRQLQAYRKSAGICAFPDGGVPHYISRQIALYVIDRAGSGEPAPVFTQDVPLSGVMGRFWPIAWTQDGIYVSYSVESGGELSVSYFRIDAATGKAQPVSEQDGKAMHAQYYRRGQWLSRQCNQKKLIVDHASQEIFEAENVNLPTHRRLIYRMPLEWNGYPEEGRAVIEKGRRSE